MQTLSISKDNAVKAYKEATDSEKKMLANLVGIDNLVPRKITDRVQDFNDVLDIEGITMDQLVQDGDTGDEIAYKQAKLIARVYNEGVELDGRDESQYKYYPWHKIDPRSGFGLSYDDCDGWYSTSYVGVRLCFKSAELAIDAGKKFVEIYANLKIN